MKLRVDPKGAVERTIGVGALMLLVLGPVIFNDYWINTNVSTIEYCEQQLSLVIGR